MAEPLPTISPKVFETATLILKTSERYHTEHRFVFEYLKCYFVMLVVGFEVRFSTVASLTFHTFTITMSATRIPTIHLHYQPQILQL